MPDKHPNTVRWGGPGASHEDATKPMPEPPPPHPDGATSTNPRVSQVSGGGGERDEKHSAVDPMRSSKSHATDGPSPTSSREWRQNRSRRDRAADAEAAAASDAADDGDHDAEANAAAEDDEGTEAAAGGEGMLVVVNRGENVQGGADVAASVEARVRRALGRFERRLTRVEAFLSDANAAKSGPADKACSLEARPRNAKPVAATHSAPSFDAAVDGAAAKLARLLDTEFGRRHSHKGAATIRGT